MITRHARDLHAGDIIAANPDHRYTPVRWRVTRPPTRTSDAECALVDWVDLDDGGEGIGVWPALAAIPVEPAAWLESA